MQTDLPEPVAPAISIWGILAMSVTTTLPAISFPTAKAILDGKFWNSGLSSRSRRATIMVSLLGTSIPIAALPGIGASIRISVAARFSLMSSVNPTILDTFTPCSGCSSYLVTLGPWLISVMVTRTPKVARVCWRRIAVSFSSLVVSAATGSPFCSLDSGGSRYSIGFFTTPCPFPPNMDCSGVLPTFSCVPSTWPLPTAGCPHLSVFPAGSDEPSLCIRIAWPVKSIASSTGGMPADGRASGSGNCSGSLEDSSP